MERNGTAINVLLVDDSADNRFVVEAYLRNSPYVLDIAEDGEIAVRKFIAARHHLVLMDIHMPVMDGLTAVRKIRQWERQQNLEPAPILALTASVSDEGVRESLAAGCTAYLSKPIRKATLLEAIERFLGGVTSERAAGRE